MTYMTRSLSITITLLVASVFYVLLPPNIEHSKVTEIVFSLHDYDEDTDLDKINVTTISDPKKISKFLNNFKFERHEICLCKSFDTATLVMPYKSVTFSLSDHKIEFDGHIFPYKMPPNFYETFLKEFPTFGE